MNLYITDTSMQQCALNLDNNMLKRQISSCSQILSNVFRASNDYTDTLEYCQKRHPYSFAKSEDYRIWLLPMKNENHAVVKWTLQTPLHIAFVLNFYRYVYSVASERDFTIPTELTNFYNLAYEVNRELQGILPIANLTGLYCLENELYRGGLEEFEKDSTIDAYRKRLIRRWKIQIAARYVYERASAAYQALPSDKRKKDNKPRIVKKLAWRNSYTPPLWALEEIIEFKKGLVNAIF